MASRNIEITPHTVEAAMIAHAVTRCLGSGVRRINKKPTQYFDSNRVKTNRISLA